MADLHTTQKNTLVKYYTKNYTQDACIYHFVFFPGITTDKFRRNVQQMCEILVSKKPLAT